MAAVAVSDREATTRVWARVCVVCGSSRRLGPLCGGCYRVIVPIYPDRQGRPRNLSLVARQALREISRGV